MIQLIAVFSLFSGLIFHLFSFLYKHHFSRSKTFGLVVSFLNFTFLISLIALIALSHLPMTIMWSFLIFLVEIVMAALGVMYPENLGEFYFPIFMLSFILRLLPALSVLLILA